MFTIDINLSILYIFSTFVKQIKPLKMNNLELIDIITEIHESNIQNYDNRIFLVHLDGTMGKKADKNPFPFQLNACTILLVISGEVTIIVDYKEYSVKKNSLIFLVERHILNNLVVSNDFLGFHIFIDHYFVKHSTQGDLPPKEGIIYSSRQNPVFTFEEDDFKWLLENTNRLSYDMSRQNHQYKKSLIINDIAFFIYEIWNKTSKAIKPTQGKNSQYDEIALRFFDLVFAHCKKEHDVRYYAEQLNITPVHLSRVIKSVMGNSALKIIHDVMLTEIKIQLRKPDLSIQQISDNLNFSDQASLSKFFKKNTGISPKQFRK